MKKPEEQAREELDQFEAYGEYSYAYRHGTDGKKHRNRRAEQPEDADDTEAYSQPMEDEYEEETAYLSPEEELEAAREKARKRSRSVVNRLIFLLVLSVGAIILLQGMVFRLKTVYVIGNVNRTAQEVTAASGLVKGLNIFSISSEEIEKNLSSDHTIHFLGMQKDYPSTVYLYIAEREAVASIQWLGLLYTLDNAGMVMEEYNTMSLPPNMPSVTGLQVTSIHVGQKLETRSAEQLNAYFDIIGELGLQYYRNQIQEINLSDLDNLYLLTNTGISVRLGNRQYMRAKIGALRTDIAYLQQLGKTSGILDVSIPEDAKYRPES